MAINSKGGKTSVFDIRKQDTDVMAFKVHDGPKAQKNAWINATTIITSGFNRQAEREYATWDIRNTSQAVARGKLGDGAGVGHLYFDMEHGILYNAGRGDMAIGIYQYSSALPSNLNHLYDLNGPSPTKGFSLLPKWCLDPQKHEIDRGVHMTNDKHIQYRSFTLANKTGLFQEELYPPFMDNKANNTYAEWIAGVDKPAIMK